MGIISDYLEQAKDHHGGLESKKLFSNPEPVIIKNAKCPLCGDEYINESDVHAHILAAHRDHQQYLKVNDVIVNDFYYCEHIDSIEVIYIGNCGCKIVIDVGGRDIPIDEATMSERYVRIDISKYLDVTAENKIKVKFIYSGSSSEIIIYQNEMPAINEAVITRKLTVLQSSLSEGKTVDWNDLVNFINNSGFNEIEQRYLNGFFEYYYAYYLDSKESDRHYETAFSMLLPFVSKTPMASTVVKFLCLKLNWVERLVDLCRNSKGSVFYHIAMFLSMSDYIPESKIEFTRPPDGLLVTNGESDYMNAVIWYVGGDFAFVEEYINSVTCKKGSMNKVDENLKDRMYLLIARNERRKRVKNKIGIEDYYERIISPFYKKEAEAYRNAR